MIGFKFPGAILLLSFVTSTAFGFGMRIAEHDKFQSSVANPAESSQINSRDVASVKEPKLEDEKSASMQRVIAQAERDFSNVECPDQYALAEMLIQAEVYGRKLIPMSKCVNEDTFPSIIAGEEGFGENKSPAPLNADPDRPYSFFKSGVVVSPEDEDVFTVQFRFRVQKKNGSVYDLPDQLVFRKVYGEFKRTRGCAAILASPRNLVVLPRCQSGK